jgi:TonB-dependent receptor
MRIINTVISCLAITIFFLSNIVLAAGGSLQGFVKDAKTGEALVGANIVLVGTSMGNATDMDGKYVISHVPPGSYTILTSYIGYKAQKVDITVKEGAIIKQDFNLEPVGIEGKTTVVTAQASGQSAAINQQLASDQIINVVSAAKIQELPDANAAESVGRLPGISILRNGGEGNEVVIRGMQPKYNKVLIDGVEMSSSDPNDRSTDLSVISSNMLDGIQVSKTVTPDMSADVLGGTVNFELHEARVKEPGVPVFNVLAQGAYNGLSDAANKLNNYKYVVSGENRYFDDKLGIFAQVDIERKNLSSNELGAVYDHLGASLTNYQTNSLVLQDILRDRERYNGALVIDYKLPEGKIKFSNFASTGSTNSINRSETFDILDNFHIYQLTDTKSTANVLSNSLGLEQQVSIFQIDAKISHTYSETKDPYDWYVNFLQSSAGLNKFTGAANINPIVIPNTSNNDLSQTLANAISTSSSFSRERALSASLDLKTNINFSDQINADIKFGGMYRHLTRSYNYDIYDGGGLQFADAAYANGLIISEFNLPSSISFKIPVTDFMDPGFSYGKFLGGNYKLGAPLSLADMYRLANLFKSHTADFPINNNNNIYGLDNFLSTTSDYSGTEDLSAFYLMTVINIGPQITLIPGVRYQNNNTSYTGARGIESRYSFTAYDHIDTTVTQSHGYWLPDVSLRYKPFTWCDVRLAYTNTLSYPDYNAIIPRIDVGTAIAWNNYKLVPQRSANYDGALSFYDNTIGLFTVGGFLKQIKDLIYGWQFYVAGKQALQYFPPNKQGTSNPTGTYVVNTFVNDPYTINNYGIELDWQTHFWYLPGPLSGLVFSVNYTHIFSKAQYPYTLVVSTGRTVHYVDTSYTARLLDQPNDIANFSIGYDYRDLSVRVSMLYQANIFSQTNFWPQIRANTSAYTRWDLAIKQGLPWFGVQIYGDVNNINGAKDVSVIQGGGGVPLSEQDYGLMADLGLRWNF